jgi:transcriptional regulator GlxA family with amidase domain
VPPERAKVILRSCAGVFPDMPVQRAATVELRTSLFEDAVEIVEREYGSDLSLDDIARRVASSRRQLQRAYTEIGNTTFRDHVTAIRMRRASEMLQRSDMTVREVANNVGYRQPAQFAKAFRRALGVAPSAYRQGGGGAALTALRASAAAGREPIAAAPAI